MIPIAYNDHYTQRNFVLPTLHMRAHIQAGFDAKLWRLPPESALFLLTPRRGNDAYRAQQWSLAKECYDLAIAADALRMDVEHLESQEPVSLSNVSIPARYDLGECLRNPSG